MLTLAAADTIAGSAAVASQITCTLFGMERASGTEVYKVLYQGQLPTGIATLYTVPASTEGFIRTITIVNNDASARLVILARGGTAAANRIFSANIPAGGMAIWNEGWQVFDSDGKLQIPVGSGGGAGDPAEDADISTQAFGDSPTAGANLVEFAPAAHKHGMPADPVTGHVAAGDPHTQYRLESADHSHASTGLQGGTVSHAVLTSITPNDHHNRDHQSTHLTGGADVLALVQDLIFIIDGGGATITTGIKGDIEVPFPCTINQWTLLADQSGSIVVDLWKDTYANFPPVVGDVITASAKPTISSATKGQSSTLTGWTTTIAAGDIIRVNVNSVTTIQRVTLALKVTRT